MYRIIAVLALLLLYFCRAALLPALTPFVLALALSYLLAPFVRVLEGRNLSRPLAILIVFGVLLLFLVMSALYGLPALTEELGSLTKQLPSFVEQIEGTLSRWEEQLRHYNLPPAVTGIIEKTLLRLEGQLDRLLSASLQFVLGFFESIIQLVLIPIISFYMLKDTDLIRKGLLRLTPQPWQEPLLALLGRVDRKLGAWIRGQLTVGLVVGFLVFIGLYLVGMNFALVLGLTVAITNIIPYFGPIIGAIPALFLALLKSPAMFLKVLGVQVVAQQLESNLVTPQVLGHQLGLHPLVIIFALLLGAQIGGVFGLLFAVPAAAIVGEVISFWREQA